MPRRKKPAVPDALLDQLLAGADARTAFDQGGLLDSLKKALSERALNAEMDHHLAGEEGAGNSRNGYGRKTVTTDTGKIELEVPRDRQATFDPQLIAKYQRRFPGFDDKIVSMYARGMSTREIVGHLRDLYGVDVSPDLISAVTDAVLDEVATWQARPLEAVYPLVFFDALRVKIRDEDLTVSAALNKMSDRDRSVREDAAKAIGDAFGKNIRLVSLITHTLAKDKEITDGWRRYPRRLARLAGNPRAKSFGVAFGSSVGCSS